MKPYFALAGAYSSFSALLPSVCQHAYLTSKCSCGIALGRNRRIAYIARFADLHDLKPLKYRCFDVLAENYVRWGLKVDEIFKEDQPDIDDGEPQSKKMRGSGGDTKEKKEDDVSTRLMHEFTEYLCGRMEGVRVLECGDKAK